MPCAIVLDFKPIMFFCSEVSLEPENNVLWGEVVVDVFSGCVHIYVCMRAHACRGWMLTVFYDFLKQCLSLNLELIDWVGWSVNSRNHPVSTAPALGL